MYLGLDVGGTHTDAVLVDESGVRSHYKAVTDHSDLLKSINLALEKVTEGVDRSSISRVNLSTTLSTNAIVENKIEKVAVIISAGPGIDPGNFAIGEDFYIIDGSIDHRGTVVKGLDAGELTKAVNGATKKGLKHFAVVTKFSTRNPDHENQIVKKLEGISEFTTAGHRLSGQLNFPRRITTAYYNSAVWSIYNRFSDAIAAGIRGMGIDAEINILKADGGTMSFGLSREIPVESILSGPAASIMGIIALCKITEDSIILDIGGTTTDIAIFASGAPLIEKDGISLNSRATLVRALKTRSIGIGGDSAINVADGTVTVGPVRRGPAMADGGSCPTLVDAFNYLGAIEFGETGLSVRGINEMAGSHGLRPDDLASRAAAYAVDAISAEVSGMLGDIANRPVYTIHEMLENTSIKPARIYAMGGPAMAFKERLADAFGLDVVIPKNYDVANAIGAAVAKTTIDVELFADTGKGILIIPNLDVREEISSSYSLKDAERDARKHLVQYLGESGKNVDESETEIVETSSFKMVQGFFGAGSDIRVKCQIKPGVVMNIYK